MGEDTTTHHLSFSEFPLRFLLFFWFYLFPRPALMCLPKPSLQVPFLNSFFLFSTPLQPLVCSLCAAFSYLFNLLPIVSLFCLHRSRRPSCRGTALLSYNLDNAGCCLCSRFFFLLSVEMCVFVSLWGTGASEGGWGGTQPICYPTWDRPAEGEKTSASQGKPKLNTFLWNMAASGAEIT